MSGAVITRFGLEDDSADAVKQLFDIPEGATGSLSVFSVLLLIASGTSFARRLASTYRSAWEQDKAGVRSSLYSALGLLVLLGEVLVLYFARTLVRHLPFSWVISVPLSVTAGLVLWTSIPWLLLDRRVHWRRLVAGGAVAAVASSIYAVATTIYMPELVNRYTTEFGLFGITIAIIGWLLATAGILVASAAIGAEFDRTEDPWARRVKDRFGLREPGAAVVPPASPACDRRQMGRDERGPPPHPQQARRPLRWHASVGRVRRPAAGSVPAREVAMSQPNILIIWGDDIGISEPELLQRRADGLPHAPHRPARGGGCPVHGLLRRAELHRRAGGVHHRPEPLPDRVDEGRHAGRRHRPAGPRTRPSRPR